MKRRGGELKPLSGYFKKYQETLTAPEASVIECFVDVIHDVLAVEVDIKRVRYNPTTKTISLTAGGPLKSEIKLHQKEILTHVKGRLGGKNTPQTIL